VTDLVDKFEEKYITDSEILSYIAEKDSKGNTCLDVAANCGFGNVCLYLMTQGATPMETDSHGRNAFHHLCYKGEFDALV
jgi:ankyrin repeat protein